VGACVWGGGGGVGFFTKGLEIKKKKSILHCLIMDIGWGNLGYRGRELLSEKTGLENFSSNQGDRIGRMKAKKGDVAQKKKKKKPLTWKTSASIVMTKGEAGCCPKKRKYRKNRPMRTDSPSPVETPLRKWGPRPDAHYRKKGRP